MFWIVLVRIIHVFSAMGWAGGAVISAFFIEPAARATSPESSKFMQYFMMKRHFHTAMTIFANLTILAGVVLYWRDSAGFSSAWMTSPIGIGFSIGAFFGILVYLWGGFVVAPNAVKMAKAGVTLQASSARPTPQQISDIQALEKNYTRAATIDTALVLLALLFMASARYFGML